MKPFCGEEHLIIERLGDEDYPLIFSDSFCGTDL
jgi:hypothetical protein